MRRRATPRFWLWMIVTTAAVFAVSFGVLQFRYARGEQELRRISEYRDDLVLRVRDLNDELAYVQTDDYIVRAARDELGLIMPSEVRYVSGSR